MIDVCAAPQKYTSLPDPRQRDADDACAEAATLVVRAILGRVDASLWTLRALGALENPFYGHRGMAVAIDERGGAP